MRFRPSSEWPNLSDLPIPKQGSAYFYVRYQGEILPVVAADDQYCVEFSDGSRQWIEKWDGAPLLYDRTPKEIKELKERVRRYGNGNRATDRYFPGKKLT